MSMTNAEKIAYVQAIVDDPAATDALVNVYLTKAKADILNRRYPTGWPDGVSDVPAQYDITQCDMAVWHFLHRGGEGELQHSENGISRRYASANAEEILSEVMQVIRL